MEPTETPAGVKHLFLDVDGVLNTRIGSLDDDKINLLRQIVSATGCQLILSSTWRKTDHQLTRLTHTLILRGLRLTGATPVIEKQIGTLITAAPRWQEIQHYLNRCTRPDAMVILDDEHDFGPLAPHHVRTETHAGLTPAIAQEVIDRLNRNS